MLKFSLLVLLCLLTSCIEGVSRPCVLKDYGREHRVCVCNATYCDIIYKVQTINKDEFLSFISSKDGLRFNRTNGKLSNNSGLPLPQASSPRTTVSFTVKPGKKYQKIMGFGGAFTDAAGINIKSLSKMAQENLMRSYFSEHGIEYNLCRLPISGTDFSTHPYSYDDGTPDPQLSRFALAQEDLEYKIPLIQWAKNMSEKEIHLVAASWSPPPWMKTNNDYAGFAFLKEEYYDLYSKYLLRFLDEYKKRDVNIWAMSTGNEPSNGILPIKRFNSLGWTPISVTNWTVNYFGPQLRNSIHNDTILLAFDDQRLFLPWWINLMVRADKRILEYINGFAVHWYWDFLIGAKVINDLHENYPEKFTLYTEASVGDKPWEKKVDIGSWERGEMYIADIIQNLNAWVTGWLDWSLALDTTGGPSWAKNQVDSPILVNSSADEFYRQPMFYAMGHASKFVERGGVRLQVSPTVTRDVHATAVQNPDGRIVIIMLNKNTVSVQVSVEIGGKGWVNMELPARSFATILC
ncbi:lysosomal acid glucosylceramidase-like isoform X2 [Homalodisca vitripennis]|nr:lysosomal acid glucosylceramidase-like isoform X2 [Homalodisca vitripennis]XP_046661459.1 lysosomal acid glucosylceramidase-like isoform X2 [Homalodisca vitripennis]